MTNNRDSYGYGRGSRRTYNYLQNRDDRFSDYTSLVGPDHFKETIYKTPYPLTLAQVKDFLNIYDDSQDSLINVHIPVVYDILTGVLGYPSAPATFFVNVPVSWVFELTRNSLVRIPIAVVGDVSGLTFLFHPKAGAGHRAITPKIDRSGREPAILIEHDDWQWMIENIDDDLDSPISIRLDVSGIQAQGTIDYCGKLLFVDAYSNRQFDETVPSTGFATQRTMNSIHRILGRLKRSV